METASVVTSLNKFSNPGASYLNILNTLVNCICSEVWTFEIPICWIVTFTLEKCLKANNVQLPALYLLRAESPLFLPSLLHASSLPVFPSSFTLFYFRGECGFESEKMYEITDA